MNFFPFTILALSALAIGSVAPSGLDYSPAWGEYCAPCSLVSHIGAYQGNAVVNQDLDTVVQAVAVRESGCRQYSRAGQVVRGDHGRSIGMMQIGPHWYKACGGAANLERQAANVECGRYILANLTAMHGLRDGLRRYNGSGVEAERYADQILGE